MIVNDLGHNQPINQLTNQLIDWLINESIIWLINQSSKKSLEAAPVTATPFILNPESNEAPKSPPNCSCFFSLTISFFLCFSFNRSLISCKRINISFQNLVKFWHWKLEVLPTKWIQISNGEKINTNYDLQIKTEITYPKNVGHK